MDTSEPAEYCDGRAAPLVQELTARSAGLSTDLRFVKELQWRVIYHCILAYAALVGAFQIPTPIGGGFGTRPSAAETHYTPPG